MITSENAELAELGKRNERGRMDQDLPIRTTAFWAESPSILFTHPNTLDYHLRRIRDLTGLSPTAPRDIQALGAAMKAWDLVAARG